MTSTTPSNSTLKHKAGETDLSQGIQNIKLNDNERQSAQANSGRHLQRNVDLSQAAHVKNPQLSTESQNFSEDIAARNLYLSQSSTNPQNSSAAQDHFVPRRDGGFKLNDGTEDNSRTQTVENGHDPNIPPIHRKPLPSDSDVVSDHTNTSKTPHYPLPTTTTKNVFDTLRERRLPLAGTAGRELGYSEDVSQHTKQDEAVVHETVKPVIHEVRHEKITREFVETHIVHRIQPIDQIEYLPARHFVEHNGVRKEVREEDVLKELGLV